MRAPVAAALAASLAISCGDDPDRTPPATAGGAGTGGGASTTTAIGGTTATGGGGVGNGGPGGATSCAAPESHTGEATYYDFADGSGNCSFDPTPQDLMIGAMNHTDYADSAACGSCVELTGPNATIAIRIVDRCPECPAGDIDLSPEAFGFIAELSAGRVPITWHYVECNVTGPVIYHFKEGSNQWWTAVQLRNHRNAIAAFAYRDDGGSWVDVPRESYNYFVEAAGMGPGPYAFRTTDVHGNVIEDEGIAFAEAADVAGTSQFPPCR
ncbi:MAG: hypothetical protein JRI23_06835 [Deltaproteobacteria bacterium]|nr:hypothetical protein [Deltaproteobacteria bacterium]MBW2531302.1 hypothetical protein [Deltaproteobacteria bacterium]